MKNSLFVQAFTNFFKVIFDHLPLTPKCIAAFFIVDKSKQFFGCFFRKTQAINLSVPCDFLYFVDYAYLTRKI